MISRVNSLRIGARYFVAATLILSLLVSSFGIERFSLAQGAEETVEEPVVVENNHSGENVEPPPQSGETPAENPEGEASISTEQPDAQSEPAGTTSLVIPVTGVTVTPETATINVGGTVALTAAVEPAEATNQAVAWASDNEAIATVDATGLVTAVAAGAATITAATAEGNFTATGTISVFANDNFVNRVVLSGLSGKISGGNAGATKESGEPNHGGNIGGQSVWFEWTAPVSGTVEVNTSGSEFDTLLAVYTGARVGRLRRVVQNNDFSDQDKTSLLIFTARAGVRYQIAVDGFNATADPANAGSGYFDLTWEYTAIPVTGVTLDQARLTLGQGDEEKLTATVLPAKAFNQQVTWASNRPSVASVDPSTGLVTANSPGTAVITVTTADGNRRATCRVTVLKPIEKLTIDLESLFVETGRTAQLNAWVHFTDGTRSRVTATAAWSSSDHALATVTQGRVRGVAVTEADTFVTITAEFAGREAEALISVIPRLRRLTAVTTVMTLEKGQTLGPIAVTAVYIDGNVADVTDKVTWSSRNNNIASIENGDITAEARGRTTITAAFASQRVNIAVHVIEEEVTALDIFPLSLTLEAGLTANIRVRAKYGTEAGYRSANVAPQAMWSSAEPSIVTVDRGQIRAISSDSDNLAETTITVTFGRQKVTIPVSVIPRLRRITADDTTLELMVGDTYQAVITADYRAAGLANEEVTGRVTWSSRNDNVATVNENGVITAKTRGRATISAVFGSQRVNIAVNVRTDLPKASSVTHGEISALFGVYRVYANQVTGLLPGEDVYFYIWSAHGGQDDLRSVEGHFNSSEDRWEATADIFYHGYHLGEYIVEAWAYDLLDQPLNALGSVNANVTAYTGPRIVKPAITWNGELQPLSGPVEKLIQHHMAHRTWNFFQVHECHKSLRHEGRSWFGIGYNYWIGFDGTIFEGRGMMRGAQAGAFWNGRSIGIGFQGHFDHQGMTDAQVESGAWLNAKLLHTENLSLNDIIGHRNVQPTLCPGRNFRMSDLRNRAAELLGIKTEGTAIVGPAEVTVEQAQAWARVRGAHQRFIDIAPAYWHFGALTGIRPEVLYAQSAKETAFGRYGGVVIPEMNNWAGIKTREGGPCHERASHQSFPTPEEGVRAHFNHMSAYVGLPPVGEPHPRYFVVAGLSWAGTIRFVEELGGRWAPAAGYGKSIIDNFLWDLLH